MNKLVVSLALVLLPAPVALARQSLVGTWEGAIGDGAQAVRTVLHLSLDEEGALAGTVDSPEQDAFGLALSEIERDGEALSFRVPASQGAWEGRLDGVSGRLLGVWKQRGAKIECSLERVEVDPIVGSWQGLGEFGAIELRIVFNIGTRADGTFGGSMVSPDQSSQHVPAASVEVDGDTIRIDLPAVGAVYEGELNATRSSIEGHLLQAGGRYVLNVEKSGAPPVVRRPQTPEPPFPYRSEDVTYANAAAGNRLAGTLTMPKEGGPFPAAILITGSGQQNRDEELFAHKPFLVIADHLTRHGIAVLRVDDRAIGGSTGDVVSATSLDFATDVSAGIDYLKTRAEIRHDRIGLIGHSEGGMIGPLTAVARDDVAFLVLLAGPGIPGDEILFLQAELIARAAGAGDAAIAANRQLQSELFRILREESDISRARERMRPLLTDANGNEATAELNKVANAWFQYFVQYDPAPVLRDVHCPVLAVNGALDLQVPAKENLAGIRSALEAGGNTDFQVREFAALNHLFQPCETGTPNEYAQIEETFSPEVLGVIADWIAARALSN